MDDAPVVEPYQHDDVPVVLDHVLVDEDEDPEEDEFEEEKDPQKEEDDIKVDIKEDENEPELTYLIKRWTLLTFRRLLLSKSSTAPFLHKDINGLLPGLMRRDINSLFGRMALCGSKTAHALVEKKGKAKDEFYGKLILDLGNEVCSCVDQEMTTMEKLVEKFGNAEDKFPVIHQPPQETSVKILHDQENVINSVQTFLRKFNRYSFFETPKVLLLAWDRVSEIKDAFGNKQYKLEDIQELFRKLFNDVQNIHEELIMFNQDSSIISSPKIDSLLKEFSGELAHINLISSRINEADFDPEKEIHLVKKLLYDNSSPRPLEEPNFENYNAVIESFSSSPIPVEGSDSLMEEIDLFLTPDDSMPQGIENDDYDSEGDILFLEEFLSNDSLSLPENESFHPLVLLRNPG
nr:hypothetical protein [Tanacetum cinerariifolium]